MSQFFKAYSKYLLIAFMMVLLAGTIYRLTFEDPLKTEQRVTELIREVDSMYGRGADEEEKRLVIWGELARERRERFWTVLFESLAEALLLSAIMIATVEGFTRYMATKEEIDSTDRIINQLREQANQISANVWNAIFERLVPEQIATEVEKILKADVCRIRPQYTVILMENPYPELGPGHIIVKRQLYYRLRNLTGGEKSFPINIRVLSHTGNQTVTDKDGNQVSYPRICEVRERNQRVELTEEQRVYYQHTVVLPKMTKDEEAWEVFSAADEVFNLTDRALYVLTLPCYGLELQVINQIPHLVTVQEDNVYLTAGSDRLRLTTPQKWVCDTGLLSGTALSLSWKAVP